MPRFPDDVADIAIFLYASEVAALKGQNAGGSGFLVFVPSEAFPQKVHVYAVTNQHLIDDGFCALRLNRKSGDTDCISTVPEDWFLHPDGDDVAVFPLEMQGDFKWNAVAIEMFADRRCVEMYNIGYGDDVFLVGRLTAQSGKQKNTPVIRFGNISLSADPTEPVKHRGREQEAYLVECRSISGFSGSPVFVYGERHYAAGSEEGRDVWEFRKKRYRTLNENPPQSTSHSPGPLNLAYMPWTINLGPLLLGVDFGHLPHWDSVFQFPANKKHRETEYKAQSNTGVAGVVPSWKIIDILYAPKLVEQRAKDDEEMHKKLSTTI